eukprot:c5210_g1_i1.p1 GENE.c5210_g1_i1~~c5210_g1_i1.p1  ORF type:complete len:401 (+),score=93.06 c5210_g1_i1:1-1203(+)
MGRLSLINCTHGRMKWILCLLVGVAFAEQGIRNVLNVGSDDVPYDSCAVSVGYNEDTRVELFVLGADDAIWHRAQPTYTSAANDWSAWSSLGGSFKDGPSVIRNAEGRLMVFDRGFDNKVYFKAQLKANGGAQDWGAWESLEGDLFSRPSVILNSEGLIHVFGRARDNTLTHRTQFSNETGIYWGEWENLGGTLAGAPTAIVDSEGLLHIFARATDRSLFHLTQIPKAEFMTWSTWKTMGGTLASNPRVPLLNNDVNLLEIVVRGSDKSFWVKAQASNHHDTVAWSKWGNLGGVFASGPATLVNADGLVDVFGRGVDKRVYGKHQYMTEEGTAWTAWTDYGGVTTTAPEVARRPDGTIVLISRNPNKAIDIKYQIQNTTDFSLAWSDWVSLGGVSKTFAC